MEIQLPIIIGLSLLLLSSGTYWMIIRQSLLSKISNLQKLVDSAPKYSVGSVIWVFIEGTWIQDVIVESKLDDTTISIRTKSMNPNTYYSIHSAYVKLFRSTEDYPERDS